ncbi:sulfotransferase [Salinibacter ruber]
MSTEGLRRIPRHDTKIAQIVGAPRSGTTLLATMLDTHSQAVCLIEPFLAWLKEGAYDYDWKTIDIHPKAFSCRPPQHFLSFLCESSEYRFVSFKETFRTEYHPAFPTKSFILNNQSQKGVDRTFVIIRDPRDIWSSIVRRHPHFREDTFTFAEIIYAWNCLCNWVRTDEVPFVRYEDIVVDPRCINKLLKRTKLSLESSMLNPKKTPGYGDSRAQEEENVNSSSVGRYQNTISADAQRFIEAQCKKNMYHFRYK